MAVDKEKLLQQRFGIEEVEVEGVGTVKIRALSRAEALSMRGVELEIDVMEQKLLAMALVDPKLTEEEVATWQANSVAGEMQPVVEKIVEISGMEKAAAKAAFQQFSG